MNQMLHNACMMHEPTNTNQIIIIAKIKNQNVNKIINHLQNHEHFQNKYTTKQLKNKKKTSINVKKLLTPNSKNQIKNKIKKFCAAPTKHNNWKLKTTQIGN